MAIKEYSTFSKAPGLEPHHQMQFSVTFRILVAGTVLPLCRDADGVFYDLTQHYGIRALISTFVTII